MAKKLNKSNSDRSNPKKNKSLAIRTVLDKMPSAKASEVVSVVKREFGHDVKQNMVYMVKTKMNMASDGRPRKVKRAVRSNGTVTLSSASQWVDAIKLARQLLDGTGLC